MNADYQMQQADWFYHPFYGKMRRRLSRVASCLAPTESVLFQVVGVAHAGDPGQDIYTLIGKSDILTLELSRTVVAQPDIGLHVGNEFWSAIVDYLKTNPKAAYGVSLNRDAVSALKRFVMHLGRWPLPSPLVIELLSIPEDGEIPFYLPEKDLSRLNTNRWATCEDAEVYYHALHYFLNQRKKHKIFNDKIYAYELAGKTSLHVWVSPKDLKDDSKRSVTFFLPPHDSLIETYDALLKAMRETDSESSEHVLGWNTMEAFETILFAPSSLTEAKEITYALDQSIKKGLIKPSGDRVVVTHIGGRGHMYAIADLLKQSIPHNTRMEVVMLEDPRLPPMVHNTYMILLDRIPVEEACRCVVFNDHEVMVKKEPATGLIMETIRRHFGEYSRALEYERIGQHHQFKDFRLLDNIPGDIALDSTRISLLVKQRLDQMSLNEVTRIRKQLDSEEMKYRDLLQLFGIPSSNFLV